MSYVIAVPELMAAAAADLTNIGSDVSAAHTAAATSTVALIPAAADEVSASVAHLFSRYAEDFHALAGRAAAFPEHFAQNLTAGAHSYASAEALNVSELLWLVQNAGVYSTIRTLWAMLVSNNVIFQMIQGFVQPLRFILGGIVLLLFLAFIGILYALSSFLKMFGL
jgi:hypothetical protein